MKFSAIERIILERRVLGTDENTFHPYFVNLEEPVLQVVGPSYLKETLHRKFTVTNIDVYDTCTKVGQLRCAVGINGERLVNTFYPEPGVERMYLEATD